MKKLSPPSSEGLRVVQKRVESDGEENKPCGFIKRVGREPQTNTDAFNVSLQCADPLKFRNVLSNWF